MVPGPGGLIMLKKLVHDVGGATAIEYGLIAALISLAAMIAFQALGLSLVGVLTTLTNAMRGG
jgi:pilus assembly protein Flp/PilA